jgi:hypothetical protein
MLTLYENADQAELTPDQAGFLSRLVREELK